MVRSVVYQEVRFAFSSAADPAMAIANVTFLLQLGAVTGASSVGYRPLPSSAFTSGVSHKLAATKDRIANEVAASRRGPRSRVLRLSAPASIVNRRCRLDLSF